MVVKYNVGPVGSVFQVLVASTAGAYVGNVVSDAKLFVAKFSPGSGTVNITDPIIDWALSGADDLEQVLLDNNYYFVSGGDSNGTCNERYYWIVCVCRQRC